MHNALLAAIAVLILERDQLLADLVAARSGALKLTREERAWMLKRMAEVNGAIAERLAPKATQWGRPRR